MRWRLCGDARRRSALAGLGCALGAGVAMLLELTISTYAGPSAVAWWWTAYLLYLLVLLAIDGYLPRPPRIGDDALLTALVVLGITVFLLYPDQGWTAILLVVSAAATASRWRPRAVAGVIALQTLAVVTGVLAGGWPASDVIMSAVAYGTFQGFAALVVQSARREAEAHREVAVAHAELHTAAALLEATSRDAERLRISRDLHDVVGHKLTALALELEVASHLVTGDGREQVARARSVAKDLLTDVRATVGQLRESRFPLERMLRSLADEVPGLDVTVEVGAAARVEGEHAHVVLRCVQEVITNTLRHAAAGHLHVLVRADDDGIRVETRDDGRGASAITPGNGLTGMRERFEALGGTLELRSAPGAGFTTVGRLPVRTPSGQPA
ncbi:signal transduction histidine kinase [Prauserella shujinwangii]|uniref:Signal transduction histidine kinase n=1 Tax=Prauserella shujinwangii TaxID=1453103 RepID=A0A2T0M455_9PSEU|nr:sensor histidine kinase [Prauserella shujinwangii]PRX51479.1 signal transduction histidine kinase [Prauserella shujinwangii]